MSTQCQDGFWKFWVRLVSIPQHFVDTQLGQLEVIKQWQVVFQWEKSLKGVLVKQKKF